MAVEREWMLNMRRLILGVAVSVLLTGCAKEGFQVTDAVALSGTLTDEGTPLFVEGIENATGMIVLEFHPIIEGKPERTASASAEADLDGNFEIPQGIEPGEYIITVRQWEPYPENDLLKGKFRLGRSKIVRTIEGDTTLDIDISNPEG